MKIRVPYKNWEFNYYKLVISSEIFLVSRDLASEFRKKTKF